VQSGLDAEVTNRTNAIQSEATIRNVADTNLNTMDTTLQNSLNNQQDQIRQLEKTQYQVEGAIRILDTRKTSVELFDSYDVRRKHNNRVGLKLTFKLGKSYEEKRIIELENLLSELIESRKR
jgi:hypothetical protein